MTDQPIALVTGGAQGIGLACGRPRRARLAKPQKALWGGRLRKTHHGHEHQPATRWSAADRPCPTDAKDAPEEAGRTAHSGCHAS
jgi:hypothetical protein